MKIIVLGATPSTRNMGLGALSEGIVKSIRYASRDAEVSFMDYERSGKILNLRIDDRDLLLPLLNLRFSKRLYCEDHIARLLALSSILKAIPHPALSEKILSKNRRLTDLNQADLVVSISGGDSFSDIYGLERFFYVSLPQILALMLGKKLVLLPQTIGPFRTQLARKTAGWIMRGACLVYSRDREGVETAMKTAGERMRGKYRFSHDLGFLLDPSDNGIDPKDRSIFDGGGRPVAGVNVSGLLYMGGYTKKNMFGLKVDYRFLVAEIVKALVQKGARVVLVPHVIGSDNPESDGSVCLRLAQELQIIYGDSVAAIRGTYRHGAIKQLIGMTDFFVGSRMHACIAALSQNVPAVAVTYSRKFTGVLESIGFSELAADPRNEGLKSITEKICRAYDERAELRERLSSVMPQVKTGALGIFKEILNSVQAEDCIHNEPPGQHV